MALRFFTKQSPSILLIKREFEFADPEGLGIEPAKMERSAKPINHFMIKKTGTVTREQYHIGKQGTIKL